MAYENVTPSLGGQTSSGKYSEVTLLSCWQPCKSRVSSPELQRDNYSPSLCQYEQSGLYISLGKTSTAANSHKGKHSSFNKINTLWVTNYLDERGAPVLGTFPDSGWCTSSKSAMCLCSRSQWSGVWGLWWHLYVPNIFMTQDRVPVCLSHFFPSGYAQI